MEWHSNCTNAIARMAFPWWKSLVGSTSTNACPREPLPKQTTTTPSDGFPGESQSLPMFSLQNQNRIPVAQCDCLEFDIPRRGLKSCCGTAIQESLRKSGPKILNEYRTTCSPWMDWAKHRIGMVSKNGIGAMLKAPLPAFSLCVVPS